MTSLLVVGSVAFDHVFTVQPTIREEIPLVSGRLEEINMSFVVSSDTHIIDGGTGSNIAYSSALLCDNPIYLFSAVGSDFTDTMGEKLENMGVTDKTIVFGPNSAKSLQISDQNSEQVIIWQPNAFSHIDEIGLTQSMSVDEIQECRYAIFAPGTPQSTLRHMNEFRDNNLIGDVLFDPGHMVNFYSRDSFATCCELSDILLINDAEFLKVKNSFRLTTKELIHNLGISKLVITKGSQGSEIITKDEKYTIPSYEIEISEDDTIETTGAGDAYRGGLLAALSRGHDFEYGCKIGSVIAAKSIIFDGAQIHETTWKEVKEIADQL